MLKAIKRIWEKVHFGVYPVLRFAKRLYYIAFVMGIVLAAVYYFYEDRSIDVQKKVDIGLNTKWVEKADETYLNVHFSVDEIPFLFTQENVQNIVSPIIKAHNYQVKARESNKRNGFVVKDDIRYSDKVRVYYTDDVAIDGKATTTLWLISENYILKRNLEKSLAKYEIPIP